MNEARELETEVQTGALYQLTGKISYLNAFPYSLQQVLCMFVTNMVPLGLVTAAAIPALSSEEQMKLLQVVMIVAGAATFFQSTPFWRFGSGFPIFMGASFTFVAALTAVASKYGYGAVMGSVIAGGLLEGIFGLLALNWRKLISPIVSGLVVTGIGFSLLSTAIRSFGGGYNEDFGSWQNLLIGFVTLSACVLWMVLTKGNIRQLSILIGLVAGYVTAALLGKVELSGILSGSKFAFPQFLPYQPIFKLDAILSVCIVFAVSATETIGDTSAVAAGALHRETEPRELSGALTIDGFGSMVSGLFGCIPVTSYSENIGLTVMTGVVNRRVGRLGGLIMILCGLLPTVGRFFATVPTSVIGGILVMVLGQIMVSGFQMIAEAGFTERNKLIAAVSLSLGIGSTASEVMGIWNVFPQGIQTVFSQNVVAIIFVVALLLNALLPKTK